MLVDVNPLRFLHLGCSSIGTWSGMWQPSIATKAPFNRRFWGLSERLGSVVGCITTKGYKTLIIAFEIFLLAVFINLCAILNLSFCSRYVWPKAIQSRNIDNWTISNFQGHAALPEFDKVLLFGRQSCERHQCFWGQYKRINW